MTTRTQLYKGAALILRESATDLAVTTDNVLVNTFNSVYAQSLRYILENGRWNHAARSLFIEADTDVQAGFGYNNAFEKPEDYCNLIAISYSPTFYPPFDSNQYRDEGNFWYANCDPLFVSIVSNGAQWGGDLSLWPEIVARALEYELAFRAAPHVTTMGEDSFDKLEKRKEKALRTAESWDGGKQPPEPLPPPRLARARAGGSGRSDSWR